MEYIKVNARPYNFNCAESGMHPNWSFDRARKLVKLAQSVGIEPWTVFPGTSQVNIETYDSVTIYQISLFASIVEKSDLKDKIEKIWVAGLDHILINYKEQS